MYLGQLVEIADSKELYKNPKHPYTQALLSAVPIPDPKNKSKRIILTGDVPSPANVPTGCYFHPRCPKVFGDCSIIHPQLGGNREHYQSCLLYPESYPKNIKAA